ncbi:MAG: hypothetical protein RI955_1215 [Bacteroidota bacterium]|jgi:hypothetical protein
MNSKIFLVLLGVFFITSNLLAQSISNQVIGSTGGFVSNSTNSISYTVAQPMAIATATNSSNILTQGFQQADNKATGISTITSPIVSAMVLFPNPSSGKISLQFSLHEDAAITFSVLNIQGKMMAELKRENVSASQNVLSGFDCSNYAAGNYILLVDAQKKDGSHLQMPINFSIVKN